MRVYRCFHVFLCALLAVMGLFARGAFGASEQPRTPGFSLDELDRRDYEILSLNLTDIDPNSPAAFQDVPAGHWAYKYVQRMADLGLLSGYSGSEFRGDQVVTRYELAVIVSNMVENYNQYLQRGYIEKYVNVGDRDWPGVNAERDLPYVDELPPPQMTYQAQPQPNAVNMPADNLMKSITDPRLRTVAPPITAPGLPAVPAPGAATSPPSSRPYGMGEMELRTGARDAGQAPGFQDNSPNIVQQPVGVLRAAPIARRSRPIAIGEAPGDAGQQTGDETPPDEDKDKKDKDKKDKDKKDKDKKDKDKKEEKVKVPKELKKVADKVELTEKDILMFETLVDYVKDELKEMKKEIKKDISDVKRTAGKNERDIEKLEEENQRYKVSGGARYSMRSTDTDQGEKNDTRTSVDYSASAWFDVYSKPRKFDDLVLRTNTGGGNVRIEYQNFTQTKGAPRNFKLRSLYAGSTSASYSFLTTFGTNFTGVNAALSLNDYTVSMSMGRTSSVDYLYAISLQSNLFNNPSSMLYLTRFASFQDKDYKNSKIKGDKDTEDVWGCPRADGNWADTFYPVGTWTAEKTLCMPPEKNSVTSIFLRYPMPMDGLFLTSEYAHSTYYRPSFKMSMKNTNAAENYSNPFAADQEYVQWRNIKEFNDQDDAYYIFFDYNKGDINIFPLGYARLGPNFVSRYFGLPGFDSSSLNLSVLPIKIQSIDLFIFRPTYTRLKQKYKYEMTYLAGGEHKPMYLDPSAMTSAPEMVNTFAILDRLNNRGSDLRLKISYWQNKLTYYLSDDITFSGSYSSIKVALGPGCVDANQIKVYDELGNVVDWTIGNGYTNCTEGDPRQEDEDIEPRIRYFRKEQSYNMYWRTSNKANLSLSFTSGKDAPVVSLGAGSSTDDVLLKLIPTGLYYKVDSSINYRLTDVSSMQFWFGHKYYKPGEYVSKVTSLTDWLHDHQNSTEVGFRLDMSF